MQLYPKFPGYSEMRTRSDEVSRKARWLASTLSLWLIGTLTLGLLHAAHAEVLELDEFRYRRLMEHAEAAGYELNAERQIGNAGTYRLLKTSSDPLDTNFYLDINEDQYLPESLDSM